MRNCHVFHRDKTRSEDQVPNWDFSGNRPAVPPLMTETVASVVYLVDEVEPKN